MADHTAALPPTATGAPGGGGFVRLPDGSVVVALCLPRPTGAGHVRVLVHAGNRSRALTRLRNLGLTRVYLRGNAAPPSPDEISAVLHHPDGAVWRALPEQPAAGWQPMGRLVRPARPEPPTPGRAGFAEPAGPAELTGRAGPAPRPGAHPHAA